MVSFSHQPDLQSLTQNFFQSIQRAIDYVIRLTRLLQSRQCVSVAAIYIFQLPQCNCVFPVAIHGQKLLHSGQALVVFIEYRELLPIQRPRNGRLDNGSPLSSSSGSRALRQTNVSSFKTVQSTASLAKSADFDY